MNIPVSTFWIGRSGLRLYLDAKHSWVPIRFGLHELGWAFGAALLHHGLCDACGGGRIGEACDVGRPLYVGVAVAHADACRSGQLVREFA